MSKLKRFSKNNRKRSTTKLIVAFLLVAVVSATISYAVYQKEDEVLFINARVGEFETSSSDIELAIKLDGNDIDTPPSKGNYNITIECDHADGVWESTDDRWGAYIYNISSNRVKCNVNFKTPEPTLSEITATSTKTSIDLSYTVEGIVTNTTCKYGTEEGNYINNVDNVTNTNCSITDLELDTIYYYQVCATNGGGETCKEGSMKTKGKTLSENVELGDYISMTPTSTSYTISTSLTGYTSNQKINPSELNLWRVIRKNEDGTVDVVSEYVSSTSVYFKGLTGFLKYIGALNTIASQYTNSKYVQSTRHMGYSDQTEYFSSNATSAATASLQNDFNRGSYKIDSDLVMNALGTTKAKKIDGSASYYSITSRWTNTSDYYVVGFLIRCSPDGSIGRYTHGTTQDGISQGFPMYRYYFEEKYTEQLGQMGWPVRPILTLKSDVEILSGDGQSNSTAYQLS